MFGDQLNAAEVHEYAWQMAQDRWSIPNAERANLICLALTVMKIVGARGTGYTLDALSIEDYNRASGQAMNALIAAISLESGETQEGRFNAKAHNFLETYNNSVYFRITQEIGRVSSGR